MPLGMTSNRLYRAQRRRLRFKRWLAHSRSLSKGLLGLIVGAGLVWGGYLLWPQVLQATGFRMQTIQITGVSVLPREEVLYLLAVPEDASMLQLDLPRMGARLMHHPAIKAVTLRRRLLHLHDVHGGVLVSFGRAGTVARKYYIKRDRLMAVWASDTAEVGEAATDGSADETDHGVDALAHRVEDLETKLAALRNAHRNTRAALRSVETRLARLEGHQPTALGRDAA